MNIVRLKAKNQVTIPGEVVRQLRLRPNELLSVEAGDECIRLVPVEVIPRYTGAELAAVDRIVVKEHGRARRLKPGRQLADYVDSITR